VESPVLLAQCAYAVWSSREMCVNWNGLQTSCLSMEGFGMKQVYWWLQSESAQVSTRWG